MITMANIDVVKVAYPFSDETSCNAYNEKLRILLISRYVVRNN